MNTESVVLSFIVGLERLVRMAADLTKPEPSIECNGSRITFKADGTLVVETTRLIARYQHGHIGRVPQVINIEEIEAATTYEHSPTIDDCTCASARQVYSISSSSK